MSSHSPESLLPGIAAYPDLRRQMAEEMARSGCCDGARIAESYRRKMQRRQERDRWVKK